MAKKFIITFGPDANVDGDAILRACTSANLGAAIVETVVEADKDAVEDGQKQDAA